MLSSSAQSRGKYKEPKPLHGVPGHIYILRNSGLKEGVLQIGLSRRSGWAKALELNRDKTNTIPGSFECIFEMRAQDGGGALEMILKALHNVRCGRKDQDFFEIELHRAEAIIRISVSDADLKFQNRFRQDVAMREYLEKESAAAVVPVKTEPVREGIFKKAMSWVSEAMN
nr:GIY-YIG nuclease family protein [uncultured Undibacterium sp.]